jgi:hypothetical protein
MLLLLLLLLLLLSGQVPRHEVIEGAPGVGLGFGLGLVV